MSWYKQKTRRLFPVLYLYEQLVMMVYPYCIISCFVMCGCSVSTLFSFGCGMPVVQGAVSLQRVLTTEVRKSHCTHCLHKYSVNVNQSVCNQIAAIRIVLVTWQPNIFPLHLPLIYILTEVSLAHCLPVADGTSSSPLFYSSPQGLSSTIVSLIGNSLLFQRVIAQDVALTITLPLKKR